MQVEVWSDVVCPWCYIGKRRLEAALAAFEHRDEVNVTWRSFELDPSAPAMVAGDPVQRLADKYGMTRAQAQAAQDRITATAAAEGLAYHLDQARPGNSFNAHRLLHLARARGREGDLKERLMAAYFVEAEAIGDVDVLLRLGTDVGLDPDECRTLLDGDGMADEVHSDEREARELGISGVPFFVIDRAYGVSGAQPAEVLLSALRQAWTTAHPLQVVGDAAAGAGCDEVSCAT